MVIVAPGVGCDGIGIVIGALGEDWAGIGIVIVPAAFSGVAVWAIRGGFRVAFVVFARPFL
jgi:hypothetical protein